MGVYNIQPYSGPPPMPQKAPEVARQDQYEAARDQYMYDEARSPFNNLPLILAALPNEDGSDVEVVNAPGAGTVVTDYTAETLPVVLSGSDLLVTLRVLMAWALPVAASTVSSGASSATSSGASSASSSAGGTSHTHSVSSTTAAASGASTSILTDQHTHKMLEQTGSGASTAFPVEWEDGAGNRIGVFSVGDTRIDTYGVSGDVGSLSVSATSHTHSVSGQTAAAESSHTHGIAHTHNIEHTHEVGPTTARVSCQVSLVIDGSVITSGAVSGDLFHVEGFAGREGVITMENEFILRKTQDTAKLLAGGQHEVGMFFSITTTDFSTGTVNIKNASFILRDASFDPRLQVYEP